MSFFNSRIYGFEAFYISVLFMLYALTMVVPIIPICLIFQICYILRRKINKFKNVGSKKYVCICCVVGAVLVLSLLVFTHSFEIDRFFEKESAKQMVDKAEEKIAFSENTIIYGGIFDMPEFTYNHILIDYDNMEVGMLLHSGYDEFWKVQLEKTTEDSSVYQHIINDYFMQADIPLNAPGKRLISFYEGESLKHRTIAFMLICEDGTIYCVDDIKENGYKVYFSVMLAFKSSFTSSKLRFLRHRKP